MEEENQFFCRVRKEPVAALPEEKVRQNLLQAMIEKLGFPFSYITVEKALDQLPHLLTKKRQFPDRRADIICFGKGIHPHYDLYPLLLIECKAIPLTEKVIRQAVGYNHHVGAYFLAVANQEKIQTGWFQKSKRDYVFVNGLPSYAELIKAITPS
jgi:hypothetical protein